MESTGVKGMIHISQDTADLIIAAGKEKWLRPREESVHAKGKGEMKTFFVSCGSQRSTSVVSSSLETTSSVATDEDRDDVPDETKQSKLDTEKTSRLVNWNVEILLRILKQMVARRNASSAQNKKESAFSDTDAYDHDDSRTLEEVREIIHLPIFDVKAAKDQDDEDDVRLPPEVVDQMHLYVSNIAQTYNDNPFHNFEHASHVTMSVVKLLSRIVAPDIEFQEDDRAKVQATLHDHTYGITSDPLTQFACMFSALIHDADHSGVPNTQLVKEGSYVAKYYQGKSVAEQNSVDLAWQLLMCEDYKDLRQAIYGTKDEFERFRQLVVNAVMATDIADPDLKKLRNARWAKAFSEAKNDEDPFDVVNRKATIVIEHLLQASDVSHTMQHWHVYRKWNEKFFLECHKAFKEGRAEKDPAEGWYQGELGFFDFYIIPLARKLKDCGVFGVSSDEYLNYAIRNRAEWERRGCEVVDEMVELTNKIRGGPSAKPLALDQVSQLATPKQLAGNAA